MRVRIIASRPASASIQDIASWPVRGPGPVISVKRRQIPYWQERGWKRSGNRYNGSYQSRHGSFWGEIVDHGWGDIEFLLYQPSADIRSHNHWVCFTDRGNDWYRVHMRSRPKDVSSGILTIERLIAEAYES